MKDGTTTGKTELTDEQILAIIEKLEEEFDPYDTPWGTSPEEQQRGSLEALQQRRRRQIKLKAVARQSR